MQIKDHFLSQEIFSLEETDTAGIFKTTPIPASLDRYYESDSYISHHQDSGSLKEKLYKFLQSFNLKYKKKILHTVCSKNAKVLDYGCGAGQFLKFIEDDFKTFGFEPNTTAKSAAKKKLEKTTIVSDLESIENGSLDAITLWHVFEHIENQNEILSLFHQKLNSKGVLIIAVPNSTSYDAIHYKEYWAAYDVPRHIFHFTKKGMKNLMTTQEWQIKKIKPLLLDSFYISVLSEKYQKNTISWLKGFYYGAISNIKASKTGQYSSLIYIIEKK